MEHAQSRAPRFDPARTVIARLGGEAKVSQILGIGTTAPYSWQYGQDRNGTGGIIPQRHHLALLDYAKENGIDLNPADFLPVREVA